MEVLVAFQVGNARLQLLLLVKKLAESFPVTGN